MDWRVWDTMCCKSQFVLPKTFASVVGGLLFALPIRRHFCWAQPFSRPEGQSVLLRTWKNHESLLIEISAPWLRAGVTIVYIERLL